MKNKKEDQEEAKERHLSIINAAKERRRQRPVLSRSKPTLNIKPTILIVCEGKNTEPSYFRHFRLQTATIKIVGQGYNTESLVKEAKKWDEEGGSYDKVWCVFDADPNPINPKQAQKFNNAVKIAEQNGFGIAYSNQAFEYWLVLHFEDHQGGSMDRDDYHSKINSYINKSGVKYDGNGNKKVTEDFFELLWPKTTLAITRAKRNYEKCKHLQPAKQESTTRVFELVDELRSYQ
jgi:RloB-like protein